MTGYWFHGGGTVPNLQDNSLIVLAANSSRKIGQVTGYLGFEYDAALPTHITQLGYPCNLDSCNDPVQDNSQDYSGPNNNFEWGTAAFGGASGGPEVQELRAGAIRRPAAQRDTWRQHRDHFDLVYLHQYRCAG